MIRDSPDPSFLHCTHHSLCITRAVAVVGKSEIYDEGDSGKKSIRALSLRLLSPFSIVFVTHRAIIEAVGIAEQFKAAWFLIHKHRTGSHSVEWRV